MAFQNRPTAQLVYGLKDASGSVATVRFHVPYDTLAAAAITAGDAIRDLFLLMTGCTVISQSLTYSSFDDAPPAATLNSRIEDKGVFVFRTDNGGVSKIEIPGILNNMLTQSGAIDRANLVVAPFIAGVIDVNAIFAGTDGSNITSLLSAYQRFRRSTRNMLPKDR